MPAHPGDQLFPLSRRLRNVRKARPPRAPRQKVLEESPHPAHLERRLLHRRRTLFHRHHHRRFPHVHRFLERRDSRHRSRPPRPETRRARRLLRPQHFQRLRKSARNPFRSLRRRPPNQAPPAQNGHLRADESGLRRLRRPHGSDLLHERLDLFFRRAPPRSRPAFLRHARTRRLSLSWPFRIHLQNAREIPGHRSQRLHPLPQAHSRGIAKARTRLGGTRVSTPSREAVEMFLQEASEHLQYLREYVSILQEIEPRREDQERLYIAAHTLSGTSASYGFPRFSEIAGKLAHVFQYALNATLGNDLHGPLTEFLSDGISLLEADLLEISDTGNENLEEISAFKERYRFAFPVEPPPLNYPQPDIYSEQVATAAHAHESAVAAATGSYFDALPEDDDVPAEILEFFQPEAEEHLQIVSDCLISLEGNNNPEEINRLFRAIHTVKGSAAQVGLKRLGAIAHRVEDLIGRLRDGEIDPSPAVVDICLESVDVLRKTLHRQWADEKSMRTGVDSLLGRIAEFAPIEVEDSEIVAVAGAEAYQAAQPEIAAPQQARKSGKQPASPAASTKSVRIALERLDRMMNTVG